MSRIPHFPTANGLALVAAIILSRGAQGQEDPGDDSGPPAPFTVTLDVPQLAAAGSARAFQFTNFQFNLYLVPVGDPMSDYGTNVLANDYENYTYEHASAGGSGRGGGYHPPRYVRGPGDTYSATYTHVTQPPTTLDAFFHFSGADVAGVPLAMSVLNDGAYSLTLTADADPLHTPITPGAPLSSGLYTLEFQTSSLAGSQVTFTVAPLPGDFNNDGVVDAADYVLGRKSLSNAQQSYDTWRANFGQTVGSGSSAIANAAVPEPATAVMLMFVGTGWCLRRRCPHRKYRELVKA
jgi:hypothetical protein